MYIAHIARADYGEVLRHAEWFKTTKTGTGEPNSHLNTNTKMQIEQLMRKPAEQRGVDMPRGPWPAVTPMGVRYSFETGGASPVYDQENAD